MYANKVRYRIDERGVCNKLYAKLSEIIIARRSIKSINESRRAIDRT